MIGWKEEMRMEAITFWQHYGEAAKTSVGFFWKAGWAFVLGYAISAMIQAFVPQKRLTEQMGAADLKSVSLATVFGAASSSCSFAALAAARSLLRKRHIGTMNTAAVFPSNA
jgi:uncharacterized membrane protein YraQ (UPF0718 family)